MPVRVPTESRSPAVFPTPLKGTIHRDHWSSDVLQGNPWNDPVDRELPVYVPPSGATEGIPLLLLLSGYSGRGSQHFQEPTFLHETVVQCLDRLILRGACPPVVLAAPDGRTTLGGSQYLNSTATGRYEDYVVDEVLSRLREKYRTGPTAILGKSSGGYGALVLALRHPELFPVAGSIAGDAYFEYCYLPEFPAAVRQLRTEGGPEALLRRALSGPLHDFRPGTPVAQAFETMAYASCYSPVETAPGEFDLPFDLETGEVRPEVWSRWLAWDPVRMFRSEAYRPALKRLRYLYLDGGTRDEFFLDLGSRVLAAEARRAGAAVAWHEYAGGHFDVGERYERMLPALARAALGTTPEP